LGQRDLEPAASGQRPADRAWLFTYGVLREPAALRALLGYLPPGGATARLTGYRRRTSADGDLYLVPAPAATSVLGIVWQVAPADLMVLDAFEAVDPANPSGPAGEYRRIRGTAEMAAGTVACWLYVGAAIVAVDGRGTRAP
jgi:gamma-glutamylcyclotransferase (GGCT)/AIG2-like uncharacterized protein YtfP